MAHEGGGGTAYGGVSFPALPKSAGPAWADFRRRESSPSQPKATAPLQKQAQATQYIPEPPPVKQQTAYTVAAPTWESTAPVKPKAAVVAPAPAAKAKGQGPSWADFRQLEAAAAPPAPQSPGKGVYLPTPLAAAEYAPRSRVATTVEPPSLPGLAWSAPASRTARGLWQVLQDVASYLPQVAPAASAGEFVRRYGPDIPLALEQGVGGALGRAAQGIGGVIGGLPIPPSWGEAGKTAGQAVGNIYGKVGEPVVAHMYERGYTPEEQAKRQVAAQQWHKLALNEQAARRAGNFAQAEAIRLQRNAINAEWPQNIAGWVSAPFGPAGRAQIAENWAEQAARYGLSPTPESPVRVIQKVVPVLNQELGGYGNAIKAAWAAGFWDTSPEVKQYRLHASTPAELLFATMLDPLNLIPGNKLIQQFKLWKTARAYQPIARSAEEVAEALVKAGAAADSVGGRLPIWNAMHWSQPSLRNQLAKTAQDTIPRIVAEGNPQLLLDFFADPDSPAVRAATGGLSSSLPAKETWALLRQMGGDDPADWLAKTIQEAPDTQTAVQSLLDAVPDAAAAFFPIRSKNPVSKLKGNVNNFTSIALMGTNPHYAIVNATNNALTAMADGWTPFVSTQSMQNVKRRWGAFPIAFEQGIGAAGGAFKGAAQATVQAPTWEPLTVLGTFKIAKEQGWWYKPTLLQAQRAEQLAAERIGVQALSKFWPQVWRREVASWKPLLKAQGWDDVKIEWVTRRAQGALNVDELRAIGKAMGPPPAKAAAQAVPPAPTAPPVPGELPQGPKRPYPGAPPFISGQQTWGNFPDLADTVPPELAEAAHNLDPAMAQAVREVLEAPVSAPEKQAAVGVLQETVKQADALMTSKEAVQQLANNLPTAGTASIGDWFGRLRKIEEEFTIAHRAAVDATVKAANLLPPKLRGTVWEPYWTNFQVSMRQFHDAVAAADVAVGQAVGLAPEAAARGAAYREAQRQGLVVYVNRLAKTWAQHWAERGNRQVIWQEWRAWADQYRARQAAAQVTYAEQRVTDIFEAMKSAAQQRAEAEGLAGAAAAVVPPPPPPAAPAAVAAAEAIPSGVAAETWARLTPRERQELAAMLNPERVAVQSYEAPPAPPPAQLAPEIGPQVRPEPVPPPVVAPSPVVPRAAPVEVAVTGASLTELNTLGRQAGYAQPAAMIAYANKHLGDKATPQAITDLAQLTPEERSKLAGLLREKIAAQPKLPTEPVVEAAPPPPAVAAPIEAAQAVVNPRVRAADISVDPARFQFKGEAKTSAAGITAAFANTKTWKPEYGRGVSLWVDPANGQTYVVNGHHRLELARRLKAEYIDAPYYIQAETAQEAYMIGALQNIAEGRGSAVDAAEVFRTAGMGPATLAEQGLSLSEGKVRQGLALANLNDTLYRAVANKQFPIARAVIIGEKLADKDMQLQLVRELDKQLAKGKKVTDDLVAELADAMVGGPTTTYEQASLFGVEAITQSNAFERAEFLAYVRGRLTQEKKLFGFAAKNAEELQRVGTIERAAAEGISQDAAHLLALFDTIKNQRGPISDLANEAATAIAAGTKGAKEQYYARITEALPDAIQRQGALPTGDLAGAGAVRTAEEAGQAGLFAAEPPTGPTQPTFGGLGIVAPGTVPGGPPPTGPFFAQLNAYIAKGRQPVNFTSADAATWNKFVDGVAAGRMMKAKAIVGEAATKMRNFALGDYGAKRNIVEHASWLFPYITWYSFSFPNWLARLATHPAYIAHYNRYKNAIHEANLRLYREETGDLNATELPPGYDSAIRINLGGNKFEVYLERLINPMNALVEEFYSTIRGAAPGGKFAQALGNYGPTLHPLIIAAYTMWLAKNGYAEAAAEWAASLKTPLDRVVKAGTALWREGELPGAQVVPPGGWEPISAINTLIRGGDIYTQRRVVQALAELYQQGKITGEQYQEAANTHSGPAWDMALQAEAVQSAVPALASWASGMRVKPVTPFATQMQAMWHDAFLLPKKGTVPDAVWQAQQDAFDAKYPWADALRMGREFDPDKRAESYAGLVLDRLNPGRERAAALAAVGLTQALLDKFYAAGYSTATMTPAEQATFAAGIAQLAATQLVPTADMEAEQDRAVRLHNSIADQAYARLQTTLTLDQLRDIESGYFASDDPAVRKAYLAQHPELAAYWDAKRAVERAMREQPETAAEFARLEDKYYTSAEDLAARAKYGADILDLNDDYLGLNTAQRRAWQATHPAEYLRLKAYWNDKYGDQPTTGGGGTATGRRDYSTTDAAWAEKRYRAAEQFGSDVVAMADYYSGLNKADRLAFRRAQPAMYAKLKQYWTFMYGPSRYSSYTRSYNRNSYSRSYYPRTYRGYSRSYSGGYGGSYGGGYSGGYARGYSGGGGGGVSSGGLPVATPVPTALLGPTGVLSASTLADFESLYALVKAIDPAFDQLVLLLFGANIADLMRKWYALPAGEKATWQATHGDEFARMARFYSWLLQQKTAGTTGRGTPFQRQLQSIPPGVSPPPVVPPMVPSAATTAPVPPVV